MDSLKLHGRLILLQLLVILRVLALALCAVYLAYRLFFIAKGILMTHSVGNPTDYILPVALTVVIITLSAIRRELITSRNTVKRQIELKQDKRVAEADRLMHQQVLKRELQFKQDSRRIENEEMTSKPPDKEPSIRQFKVLSVSSRPDEELDALIGLAEAKAKVREYKARLAYEKEFGTTGKSRSMHMRFIGNPGTGKTSIGRIMAGILYQEKRIPQNKYVEVNGNELIGQYMGETPLVVKEAFKQAAGGVLFIDEAYAITQGAVSGKGGSYGAEAVTQLLTMLENNKDGTVVIFAGYKRDMEQFFNINQGLPSRVPTIIEFADYTPLELCKIAVLMLNEYDHTITRDAVMALYSIIKQKQNSCIESGTSFSNARYVRNVVDEIFGNHSINYQGGRVNSKEIRLVDIDRAALLRLS